MKKIIVLAFLIMIIPFLGIPTSWKTILLVLFSSLIIFNTLFQNTKNKSDSREEKKENVYEENEDYGESKIE